MLMWLIALFSSIGHQVTPFTARLPNALAGIVGTLMTYYFVQRFFDQSTAFIASLILATTQKYFWHSRDIRTDILFTVFVTLAFYFFYLGYKHNKVFYIGFYFSLIFATLAKGPLGILFVLVTITVFLVFKKDLKAMQGMKWQWGVILFLLFIGPWCLILCLKVGYEPLIATIKSEFLTRINKPISHSEPFYYYFIKIWVDFLPWSLFIPFTGIYAYKKWREGDERVTFIFCWTIVIFVFLCAAKAKSSRYMLPLYPAISIIIASLINDVGKGTVIKPLWLGFPTKWIIIIMAVLAAMLFVIFPPYLLKYSTIGIGISLILIHIWIKIFLLLRQKNKLIYGCFVISITAIVTGWGVFIHNLSIYSKNETFGTKLVSALEKNIGNREIYDIRGFKLEQSLRNIVNLNLNVNVPMIKSLDELKVFLNTSSEHHSLCIIERNIFERIKDEILNNTLSTVNVNSKKYQVILVFK